MHEKQEARQLLIRRFAEKMPGIQSGSTTAFIHCLNPQPKSGYQYRGTAFNGEEIFSNDKSAYFFPRGIYKTGQILYVREDWAISQGEDGTLLFVYKAGWSGSDKLTNWKPASYMPANAARFFLMVESTEICRLGEITAKDARAAGAKGRGWKHSIQDMWDADLKKKERETISFQMNPWVQVVRFRRIERPIDWPNEISEKFLEHEKRYKIYTIRLASTGDIIAKGTAAECSAQMGYKDKGRIYTLISHITSGINKKYTMEISQEPRI